MKVFYLLLYTIALRALLLSLINIYIQVLTILKTLHVLRTQGQVNITINSVRNQDLTTQNI